MELKQIATIHTDFPEKFGSIPGTCGIFSYLGALGIFTGEERKMVTDR